MKIIKVNFKTFDIFLAENHQKVKIQNEEQTPTNF